MKYPLVRYEIYRIDVWPTVRMAFLVSALLGFLVGLASSTVFLLFSGLIRTILPGEMADHTGSALGPLTILLSLVWAPIYGTCGALFAAFSVFLYNLITRWTGGITVRLNEIKSPIIPQHPTDISSHG